MGRRSSNAAAQLALLGTLIGCGAPPDAEEERTTALNAASSDGVVWACAGQVLVRGGVVQTLDDRAPEGTNTFQVCAGPRATPPEVEAACQAACDAAYKDGLAIRDVGRLGVPAPTCAIADARRTSEACLAPPSSGARPFAGGPAQAVLLANGSAVWQEGGATRFTEARGLMATDIGACVRRPPAVPGGIESETCEVSYPFLQLASDPFVVQGQLVERAHVRNQGPARGTTLDGVVTLTPGTFRGPLTLAAGSQRRTVPFVNLAAAPSGSRYPNFSTKVQVADRKIDFSVSGLRTLVPPHVDFVALTEPLRCRQPIRFQARISAAHSNVQARVWVVDGVVQATGEVEPTFTFATGGEHRVALGAYHSGAGVDAREQRFSIACP